MLCLEILLGDELLDIVDGDGIVDVAAGAGVLAGLVADASADCGEGIFLLDELKSLGVAALRSKLYIALNGDVGGTLSLAGRGAAVHNVGAGGAVIDVVALLIPGHFLVGLVGVGDVGVGGAELLAELDGVGLAVFNALSAGNALILVDPCDEVGAHGLGRAEQLGYAQRVAGAAAAVADGGDAVEAGGLVDVVDKAVILCALEDLVCLLLGDEAVLAVLGEVDGVIVEINAHILLEVTAALAHQTAGTAAGAGADGDGLCIVDNGRQLIVGGGVGVVLNGAHDGHDAHEVDTVAENGSQHADSYAGVLLEANAEVGIFVALLAVGEDALHDAGDPDGVVVAGLAVHRADTDNAGLDQLVELFLSELNALFCLPGKVFGGEVLLKTHTHHDRTHIIVDDGVKDPVFGILVGDARVGQAFKADL